MVAVFSTLGPSALDTDLLDECLIRLAGMLNDSCYAARRCAAAVVPQLYTKWSDPQARSPRCSPYVLWLHLGAVHYLCCTSDLGLWGAHNNPSRK